MVREIRIYAEGGGSDEPTRTKLRRGLNRFLGSLCELARVKRIRWQVIPCGPRSLAFGRYRAALRNHATAFNVLLVDSEAPVAKSALGNIWKRETAGRFLTPQRSSVISWCTVWSLG